VNEVGGYIFGEPKTPKSRRTIPLPEQAIKVLKDLETKQSKEKIVWNKKQINYQRQSEQTLILLIWYFAMRPVNHISLTS
jgi:integrase